MNFKEWLSEKEFAFHRIETLVFSLISSGLLLMTVVIPFIQSYALSPIIDIITFLIVESAIVSYWYYDRSVFPKNKDKKLHIVVAIISENAKQKTRIANDFANQIKKQLITLGLDASYEVTILHNHQSRVMQNSINLYSQSLRAGLLNSEEVKKFNKLTKRLNVKFIIYGDLIKRNAENSTYCLSVEALMLHKPTDTNRGTSLQKEFQDLWKKEITFLEKEELTGFKANAEHVFFTASYMLALATFVDNNFKHGIDIWERLELYVKTKSELTCHQDKIIKLKSASYFLYSRFLYFNGQIEESVKNRTKFLELTPNEYDKYLTEADKSSKASKRSRISFGVC